MFVEAWRLERDYFYDRGMHGLNWPAVRKKIRAAVAAGHGPAELDDLIAQMVSELRPCTSSCAAAMSARAPDDIAPRCSARPGPRRKAGGYRVEHVYRTIRMSRSGLRRWPGPGSTSRRAT